ncbi:TPA: LamG domain-containing protein [Candidatus Poribacteria bacterium]|nr:LamG domain-containing protein [Candidatus Poribacteria bacterium]
MYKFLLVGFLVIGLLLTPIIVGVARLKDDTVVLYLNFDEGRGTTVKDHSKSGKTGKLGNKGGKDPIWVDGPSKHYKTALEFDGKSNFVEIEDTADFSFQTDKGITICAWVKVLKTGTDNHGQSRQPIVMKGAGGAWEYALYVYDNFAPGFSVWNCGGSGVSEPSGGNLPGNEWHAQCGSFEPKKGSKAYLDGELVTQGAANANVPCDGNRNIFIAHREDGQFLKAVIDDVVIWDYIVDPKKLKSLMETPFGGAAVDPESHLATTWGTIKELY